MHDLIKGLVEKSVAELREIGVENKNKEVNQEQESKLIFPVKSKKDTNEITEMRISEQELRFLFVRELEKLDNDELFYSVETPTKRKYVFTAKNKNDVVPIIAEEEKGVGKSGSVDLAIFNVEEKKIVRKHLVEFKYGNVKTITKDLIKLLYDDPECSTNFFIQFLNNQKPGTQKNVEDKYYLAMNHIFNLYRYENNGEHSLVYIYLSVIKEDSGLPNNYTYKIENQTFFKLQDGEWVKLEE